MCKAFHLGKNASLVFCALLLLFSAGLSFAPGKMLLLKSKAVSVTLTDTAHRVSVQGAEAPLPATLLKGRALSFPQGAFTVDGLLAFFGGKALGSESVGGVTLYHAYAQGLGKGESLAVGRVNLQIAVGEGYIAVASPVFYGSF